MSSACAARSDMRFDLADHVEQIAHEPDVRNRKDRRVRILIDRDGGLRVLHSSQMLNSAGDAERKGDVGRDHFAGLPDLRGIRRVAGVHRST